MPQAFQCRSCGRTFQSRFNGARGGNRVAVYCSRSCAGVGQMVRLDLRGRSCEQCGAGPIRPKNRRFCSLTCFHASVGGGIDHAGRARPLTVAEKRVRAAARRRATYWRDLVCVGANEYVRLTDLPSEWAEVGRVIQESRLALGHQRVKEARS